MTTFAGLSGLTAAVASWMNREDVDVNIETLIRLGEEQMSLFLRSRHNSKTETLYVASGNHIPIPDDYIELISIQPVGTWDGTDSTSFVASPKPAMTPVSFQSLTSYQSVQGDTYPMNFAETPDRTGWVPYPAGNWVFEVSYFATLEPVTDTQPYPNLFQRHGGAYLAAALVEYENFLKLEPNERGPWKDKLDAYITTLNGERRTSELSGGTLVTRSPYR